MADNLVDNFLIGQSTSTVTLKKTLDAQAMRQRAHTQNIANAETPGYKRVAVDFEDQLKDVLANEESGALRKDDLRHMDTGGAGNLADFKAIARQEKPDPELNTGINGVNIDLEMAQMAETQLRYMTALELLKRRYTSLKSAIKGQ
jgi:flagellar basal-body rod protein FlgB